MTISVKRREKKKPKCYVYYNDWTGEIISVGKSLRDDCLAPYIITQNENAFRIINGEINDQNFLIGIDDTGSERLVKKTEYLRLRERENALYLIPKKKKKDWDLRVRLYLKNHKLVFEINRKKMKRLVSQKLRNQIKLNHKIDLDFYLIRQNCPDYLLDSIEIDTGELIKEGVKVFDADESLLFDDISVMTLRQFKNYYFEILDEEFHYDQIVFSDDVTHIWKFVGGRKNPHLQITQKGKILTIESLVDSEKLDKIGIHEMHMWLYVVGESPDHFIDDFTVDMSKLRIGKIEKYEVDFDIDDVEIMYSHPTLRINKRKEV